MAGQTPILALPYPTGTDRVADGDNAMQALAEKVESYTTPWTAAVLQSGWIDFGAPFQGARYRKLFGVVYLQGMIKNGLLTPGNIILNVPAGFRPAAQLCFPAMTHDRVFTQLEMTPAGNLVNSGYVAATYVAFTLSYPVV